jgi:hypothetical protein
MEICNVTGISLNNMNSKFGTLPCFTWNFMVVYMQIPIIDAKLLTKFGILIDSWNSPFIEAC